MTSATTTKKPTALDVLIRLKACPSGVQEVREAGSLAAAWEATSLRNMVWLLGALHRDGRFSRQRLVRVLVRLAETTAHVAPPECLSLLADVSAWADGDTTIDLAATRARLWVLQEEAWRRGPAAFAAFAFAFTAFAFAFDAALCEVLRDEVSGAEVAEAMGVDLDEAFGEAEHAG